MDDQSTNLQLRSASAAAAAAAELARKQTTACRVAGCRWLTNENRLQVIAS